MLRALAVSALLAAWACPALATDLHNVLADYSITSWSKKDGLPPGTIWALAQDSDGYLWLGADFGLMRFDGVRFLPWDAIGDSPLPSLPVQALHVARDGSLWVGFGGTGGISRIRGAKMTFYGPGRGLPSGAVGAIVEDRTGTVVAVAGGELFRLTGDRWTPWRVSPGHAVRTAYAGPTGDFFVVTDAAILCQRHGSDTFQPLARSDNPTVMVAEDTHGRVWATDRLVGFKQIGGASTPAQALQSGKGWALIADRQDHLWIATWGQGLWRVEIDPQSQRSTIELATDLTGLSNNVGYSLLEDREGNIWVGTNDGLNRLTAHKFMQLSDLGVVTGLEATGDGNVWAGTADGVVQLVQRGGTWKPIDRQLSGLATRAMYADDNGALWVATGQGLYHVVGTRRGATVSRVTTALRAVSGITSDAHGGVWLYDGDRGLLRWTGSRVEPVSLPPDVGSMRIVTMFTDHTGRIWLGFPQGQVAVVDRDGTARTYGVRDGLDVGLCRAMYEDEAGTIWIVGGRGLARVSNGQFVTLHQEKGFPTNLTGLVEDDAGGLWFGSASGIVRMNRSEFDRATNGRWEDVVYNLYDTSDGVAGTTGWIGQRSALRTRDGHLWFLTVRGVTIVDPRALHAAHAPAPVRIDEVTVNERKVDSASGLRLSPESSRLEIDYTVPDLTSTLNTRFRYRLEGFDPDWVEAGTRRQAIYTNLPPRSYLFRVEANNEDGMWSRPSATWAFSVAPAFYQRPGFYAALLAAFAAMVWAAWRLRLSQVRRQFALLLGERVRLSREIHDTLLQSLVGVSLQLDQLGTDLASSPQTSREQFTRMRKQVEEYIREARQSIWNLRSSTLQRHDLATALRESGERAADNAVAFDFTVTGTPQRCAPAVEEQVLRIGQEAVTNALRHAHAQQIRMELHYESGAITLRIVDNGRGFDPAAINVPSQQSQGDGHWGVMSMKERAETVGGIFRISSAAGAGTVIETVVPVAQSS